MLLSILSRIMRLSILGKFPLGPFLRINKWIWKHLPPSSTVLRSITNYGNFLQYLVRMQPTRQQNFGTLFLRNRPQLELIRRLANLKEIGSNIRIAVLACSIGAEVYSILWTIYSLRPDLKIIIRAVDISEEVLELAKIGIYYAKAPVFERMTEEEMQDFFDSEGDQVRIKSWMKEGIEWYLADASSPELLNVLGPQDMLVANNFLCHMNPEDAEKCLRNIARLVNPYGYLFISGIDLDVREKIAMELGWKPLPDLLEEIHEGDPSLRNDWPWKYWGLEPFNKRRPDRNVRYAACFQLSGRSYIGYSFIGNGEKKRIGLLDHMGHGNLGDAATQDAIISNIKRRCPTAEIYGFSLNPTDTARRHNIPAYAIRKNSKKPPNNSVIKKNERHAISGIKRKLQGYHFFYRLFGSIYHIAITYPVKLMQELIFLFESFKIVSGLDLLIVAGGGQLSDYWGGPKSFPYTLLKWVVLAKIARVKVILLNVGASPLRSNFSKLFIKGCVSLANYRSVRDYESKELIRKIGFKGDIKVYPDSAYSLDYSAPTPMPPREEKMRHLVVGIHLMPYYDPRVWPQKDESVYAKYICELASFGLWIIECGYRIMLFGTDIYHDSLAIFDFKRKLCESIGRNRNGQMMEASISSVKQLLFSMSLMDSVITPRFHGVIFAHILNKPVLAIAHNIKISTLMKDIGLSKYCVGIEALTENLLREKFNLLIKDREMIRRQMSNVLGVYRNTLSRQSDELFLPY